MKLEKNALKKKFSCVALKKKLLGTAASIALVTGAAGGMIVPQEAHAGVFDRLLKSIGQEAETQAEQFGRRAIQGMAERGDEECTTDRSSRSGTGNAPYNQGGMSQRCRELTEVEQARRETAIMREEIKQRRMAEQYPDVYGQSQGGAYNQQAGARGQYNVVAAKEAISAAQFTEMRENCTDYALAEGVKSGVQAAEQWCTNEIRKDYRIRW